jgi:alcohol dehydrogenase (cytochrome c)
LCAASALWGSLFAQDLDPGTLLKPPVDSWPLYHGDYSGQRHSRATQITPQNARQLALAWAFQTGEKAELKSTPLLVNGVLYFTVPDNVWAVDALTGRELWHYTYPANSGLHIGHRGVAMYKDWLYFETPDDHLISLNAKDGSVRWNVVLADVSRGYWATMAPLVVRNHVLVGISGDFDNVRGFVRSIDPETGKTQWDWYATPPAGTPDTATGGTTWMTGTYDPALDLVYWGTGNPTPVLTGKPRPGDNLYTCSIVALNPDTGKLKWAFQPSPHDTHDWDAVETPMLVDAPFKGQQRKLLLQASRNGYFFVLDRITGEALLTIPFGDVNWSLGVDAKGRPIPNPAKEPTADGVLVQPDSTGLANYRSPSFDPKTGLYLVSARPSWGMYYSKENKGAYGWAGEDTFAWSKGVLLAIDYQTGKIRWKHELGRGSPGAGVLTTDSGVTFTADTSGNVIALETSTGRTLWHANAGASMNSSPMTYELGGRQYLITGVGSVLYAWALPQDWSLAPRALSPSEARGSESQHVNFPYPAKPGL